MKHLSPLTLVVGATIAVSMLFLGFFAGNPHLLLGSDSRGTSPSGYCRHEAGDIITPRRTELYVILDSPEALSDFMDALVDGNRDRAMVVLRKNRVPVVADMASTLQVMKTRGRYMRVKVRAEHHWGSGAEEKKAITRTGWTFCRPVPDRLMKALPGK